MSVEPIRAELVPSGPGQPIALLIYGFLAGYKQRTRDTYLDDLHSWLAFCDRHDLDPLEIRRTHVELYGRELESKGRAVATVAKRMSTVCSWYRWLTEEEILPKNPTAHVRRPSVSTESTTLGLDREEMSRLLFAAERGRPSEYALIALLALNGLRVSEACQADVGDLGAQRGHRTLQIVGKGDKPALIPLAPRTCRAVDLAVGERITGPLLLDTRGQRMNRHSAHWVVDKLARRAGIAHHVHPHCLRHAMVTAALDAGVPLRDVQNAARHADPRMTMRYDRARQSLDRHATYIVAAYVAGG